MAKRGKCLQRIRQNPKSVSFETLDAVLKDYGTIIKPKGGSHYRFEYVLAGKKKRYTIPFARPVKQHYVKDLLDIIDQIEAEQMSDD
jgi:hypothetical protein